MHKSAWMAAVLLLSPAAWAGTATMKIEAHTGAASPAFAAPAAGAITLAGSIQTSAECASALPVVVVRLEKQTVDPKTKETIASAVATQSFPLAKPLSVSFAAPEAGVYRVTWTARAEGPKPPACTFAQDLKVTFADSTEALPSDAAEKADPYPVLRPPSEE